MFEWQMSWWEHELFGLVFGLFLGVFLGARTIKLCERCKKELGL